MNTKLFSIVTGAKLLCVFGIGLGIGFFLCYNILKYPIEYMSKEIIATYLSKKTNLVQSLESENCKLVLIGIKYDRPHITIDIIYDGNLSQVAMEKIRDEIKCECENVFKNEKVVKKIEIRISPKRMLLSPTGVKSIETM